MELEEGLEAEQPEVELGDTDVERKSRLAKKKRIRKLHEAAEADEAHSAQEGLDVARDQAAAQPTGSEPETPPVAPMSPDCVITLMPGEMPALKAEVLCIACNPAGVASPVEVQLSAATAAAPRMRMAEKAPVVEPPTLEEYTSIEEAKALARHMLAPGLMKLTGKKGSHHKMRCCFSYSAEIAVAQVRALAAAVSAPSPAARHAALRAGLPVTHGLSPPSPCRPLPPHHRVPASSPSLSVACAQLAVLLAETSNYKRSRCESLKAGGVCPYGERCLFSHGQSDARRDPLTALYAPFAEPDVFSVGRAAAPTGLLCLTKVELKNHPLVLLRGLRRGGPPSHLAQQHQLRFASAAKQSDPRTFELTVAAKLPHTQPLCDASQLQRGTPLPLARFVQPPSPAGGAAPGAASGSSCSFKGLNLTAREFKLNPSAATFTPRAAAVPAAAAPVEEETSDA